MPMDRYAIYTYAPIDAPPQQGDLWESGEESESDTTKDDIPKAVKKLEQMFGGKRTEVTVQRIKRSCADKFPCYVLAHDRNMALLRLENEKNVSVYMKSQTQAGGIPKIDKGSVKSFPNTCVLIDFNPERRLIAIKIDSDSWRNTDTVRDLLEESINNFLNSRRFGFNIVISTKMQSRDFWDYSTHRIKKENRKLSKMTIYFGRKGTIDPGVEATVKSSPYLRALMKGLWGGSHGEVTIYDPVGNAVIDRRRKDIGNIVTIIASNAGKDSDFGLKMTYDDGIAYTCGEDVRMEIPMDENICRQFEFGSKNLSDKYELETWLDNVKEQTKKFRDVESVKRKPGRKGKRTIR